MFTFLAIDPSFFKEMLSVISEYAVKYGLRLIGAIVVLILGFWLSMLIVKLMTKARWYGKIDKNVRGFFKSSVKALLYILVLVSAVAIMGVPMASIVTVIASCGVAIGLALQGSLSNLAGGLMLLLFKPFRVGDYIVAGGYEGTVEEINIFSTSLVTIDNRRVVIPNAGLSNSALVNVTHFDTRRIDLVFSAKTDVEAEKVVSVLRSVAEAHEERLPDKPVEARFDSFGESAAKYHLRVWCRTSDYWELYYALLAECRKALEENGIEAPLPRIEIRKEER